MEITITHYLYISMAVSTAYVICMLPRLLKTKDYFSTTEKFATTGLLWHLVLFTWPISMTRNLRYWLLNYQK